MLIASVEGEAAAETIAAHTGFPIAIVTDVLTGALYPLLYQDIVGVPPPLDGEDVPY